MEKKGLSATAENPYLESYGGSIEPSAIQKRRASTLTGYNVPSPASEFLRGFSGKEPAYSVMSPDANRMRRAYNLGEQASVASQFYGSVAPLAVGSTLANAARIPGAGAQIFIGPKAKTWNAEAAALAKQLESQGVDARSIWKETGTWKGPDGKWRQEISDQSAKLTLGRIKPDEYGAIEAKTFEGAIKHQQLKRAYPELNEVTFLHYPDEKYLGANFDPAEKVVTLGQKAMEPSRGVALHELQHIIQREEGFARGGSPQTVLEDYYNKINNKLKSLARQMDLIPEYERRHDPFLQGFYDDLKSAYDQLELQKLSADPMKAYKRLAGEAEARAVQRRMSLSPQQRRETFPEQSYGIDTDLLIIKQD
jgi:hypothetical protein